MPVITTFLDDVVVHVSDPVHAATARKGKSNLFMSTWREIISRVSYIPNGKFLLCRPQGGWNDTLVQISECYKYAVKFRRKLLVDTSRSGLMDCLSRYFRPARLVRGVTFAIPASFARNSHRMSCFPRCLSGKGINYKSRYCPTSNYIDSDSGEALTFNMNREYPHQLLVHEQCGGGRSSKEFFEWARPTDEVRGRIRERLAQLPDSYVAVHVRNTDVKTRYPALFEAAKSFLENKNVLICTDSREVLSYAEKYLVKSRVYSVSQIPDTNGQSLHHNPTFTDKSVNIGALADLAAMSRAFCILHPTEKIGYQSGFAALAVGLMDTKPLP